MLSFDLHSGTITRLSWFTAIPYVCVVLASSMSQRFVFASRLFPVQYFLRVGWLLGVNLWPFFYVLLPLSRPNSPPFANKGRCFFFSLLTTLRISLWYQNIYKIWLLFYAVIVVWLIFFCIQLVAEERSYVITKWSFASLCFTAIPCVLSISCHWLVVFAPPTVSSIRNGSLTI